MLPIRESHQGKVSTTYQQLALNFVEELKQETGIKSTPVTDSTAIYYVIPTHSYTLIPIMDFGNIF